MQDVFTYQDASMRERTWLAGDTIEYHTKELDKKTEAYISQVTELECRCLHPSADPDDIFHDLVSLNDSILHSCATFERAVNDRPVIKSAQTVFREKTSHLVSKSYLLNRARTWPQGYPGDYKTLEAVYRNVPMSDGIGLFYDKHFLATPLSVAVRERKEALRDLLVEILPTHQNPRILDIACGSCREVFELAPEIRESRAQVTCLDSDPDALNFAANRMTYTGIPSEQIVFHKYNALKMVNHDRNLKEFGMQDVIYSVGFFDYLEDDVLIRLLGSLYELVAPGGKLIASFKDCRRYRTQEYHWLAQWDHFLQRTEEDMLALLDKAGIPSDALKMLRDRSGIIVFFLAAK